MRRHGEQHRRKREAPSEENPSVRVYDGEEVRDDELFVKHSVGVDIDELYEDPYQVDSKVDQEPLPVALDRLPKSVLQDFNKKLGELPGLIESKKRIYRADQQQQQETGVFMSEPQRMNSTARICKVGNVHKNINYMKLKDDEKKFHLFQAKPAYLERLQAHDYYNNIEVEFSMITEDERKDITRIEEYLKPLALISQSEDGALRFYCAERDRLVLVCIHFEDGELVSYFYVPPL